MEVPPDCIIVIIFPFSNHPLATNGQYDKLNGIVLPLCTFPMVPLQDNLILRVKVAPSSYMKLQHKTYTGIGLLIWKVIYYLLLVTANAMCYILLNLKVTSMYYIGCCGSHVNKIKLKTKKVLQTNKQKKKSQSCQGNTQPLVHRSGTLPTELCGSKLCGSQLPTVLFLPYTSTPKKIGIFN